MSIESRSNQYGSIFGDWHIARTLGSGSGGKSAVFELVRNNKGWQESSALKVISLIEERGSQATMSPGRRSEYSTAVQEQRHKAEQEVRLMEQLRGKTNIVDYLDHQFFSWSDRDGFGVDLLIRMEKLTDLRSQLRAERRYSDQEIIKIGKDICQALIICHGKKIIHRDIKPENIFFNKDNDYKLGDFGVSRIMRGTPSAMASTGIGTIAYSAPEQFSGAYDHRVDIYSLGLVLYELANGNRLPFARTSYAGDDAIQSRLSGKPLPAPGGRNPGSRLVQVILKACAFRPEKRFASAEALMSALNSLDGSPSARITPSEYPTNIPGSGYGPEYPTRLPPESEYPTRLSFDEDGEDTPRRGAGFYLAIILPAVLGVVALIVVASILLFKPSHTHSYLDATCEDSRICAECGETEGAPLGHRWLDATCNDPRTCSVCGKTTGAVLRHQWTEATVTAPRTCSLCGKTDGLPLTDPSQVAESILNEAAQLAQQRQYRYAIQLLQEAWAVYGNQEFFDAAANYRMEFGMYNASIAAAGRCNSVLLNSDGTITIAGTCEYSTLASYSDFIAVGAGDVNVIGLRANGTVVAAGPNGDNQITGISGWTNIVAIAAGDYHTVGLKDDGTIVISEGLNHCGQCDADALMRAAGSARVVAISAGYDNTLALLDNGRVVACGDIPATRPARNEYNGSCEVSGWTDIVAICSGTEFSAGLKADGTVVVAGLDVDVSGWTDIVNLFAGDYHLIGLKADGTVVTAIKPDLQDSRAACMGLENLKDIIFMASGLDHTVAIAADGRIYCVGLDKHGQCSINGTYISLRE